LQTAFLYYEFDTRNPNAPTTARINTMTANPNPSTLSGEEVAVALATLGDHSTVERVQQLQSIIGNYGARDTDAPGVPIAVHLVRQALSAEALGYQSLRELDDATRSDTLRKLQHENAVAYQHSPNAAQRAVAAAKSDGLSPDEIVWVEPPEMGALQVAEHSGAVLDWLIERIVHPGAPNVVPTRYSALPDESADLFAREGIEIRPHKGAAGQFVAYRPSGVDTPRPHGDEFSALADDPVTAGLRCFIKKHIGETFLVPKIMSGADAMPALAAQSQEDFRANTRVVNITKQENGKFAVGSYLAAREDIDRDIGALIKLFDEEVPGYGALLYSHFETSLANSDITGDVFFLDRHKAGGKSLILNTMLATPPDIVARAYEREIARALSVGEQVYVGSTTEDPREKLLSSRNANSASSLDI
jgi:hypothetical protein